jgi:hypothetical protein
MTSPNWSRGSACPQTGCGEQKGHHFVQPPISASGMPREPEFEFWSNRHSTLIVRPTAGSLNVHTRANCSWNIPISAADSSVSFGTGWGIAHFGCAAPPEHRLRKHHDPG